MTFSARLTKTLRPALCGLMAIFFCLCFPAHATGIINASESKTYIELSPYLDIYIDQTQTLDIADISKPAFAKHFAKHSGDIRNLGHVSKPIWLRFTVRQASNDYSQHVLRMSYIYIDRLELYRPNGKGGFEVSIAGDTHPVASREMPDRLMLLPLKQMPGTTNTYYLLYQDRTTASLTTKLWDSEALRREQTMEFLLLGAFYGGLLVLLLYCLSLYVASRVSTYRAYAIYIVALIFFMGMQNGLVQFYLLNNSPSVIDLINDVSIGFLSFAVLGFVRKFLMVREYSPTLDLWISRLQWLACIAFALTVFLLSFHIIKNAFLVWLIYGAIASCVGFCTSAYFALVKKTRPGRFLFIAFILPFTGSMFLVLRGMGVMPVSVLSEHGMQIGSLFEMVILAIGMADQVTHLRREKDAAQTASLTDGLTGLGNRANLMREMPLLMQQAQFEKKKIALLLIDLDGFKTINDQYGHAAGDQLLQQLAARVKAAVRTHDLVIRMGGDEFVIALGSVNQASDVSSIADKIRILFSSPVQLLETNNSVSVSSSIGVAFWPPDNQINITPLTSIQHEIDRTLKAADRAMYTAKLAGKNRVHYADS
jgi:two-component system, sensor histidine kinase LadS